MIPYVPVMRTVNNQGDGKLFGREDFRYDPDSDTYVCPGNKRLLRKSTNHKDRYTMYKASTGDCGTCSLKPRCTQAPRRGLARHLYEEALNRMQKRVTPEAMMSMDVSPEPRFHDGPKPWSGIECSNFLLGTSSCATTSRSISLGCG
jgi:hypothetical protein